MVETKVYLDGTRIYPSSIKYAVSLEPDPQEFEIIIPGKYGRFLLYSNYI